MFDSMYSIAFDVLINIMKALLYSEVDKPSKFLIKTSNVEERERERERDRERERETERETERDKERERERERQRERQREGGQESHVRREGVRD